MSEQQPNPQFWSKFLAPTTRTADNNPADWEKIMTPTLVAQIQTRARATERDTNSSSSSSSYSDSSSGSESDEEEKARSKKVARVDRDVPSLSTSGKRPPTARPSRSEQTKTEIRRVLETRAHTKQRKLALDDAMEEIGDRRLLYKDQERESELMRLRQPCARRLTGMTPLVQAFLVPSGGDTRRPIEPTQLPTLMTQLDEKQLFLLVAQGALTLEAGVLCRKGVEYACIVGRDAANPLTLVFYIVQRI